MAEYAARLKARNGSTVQDIRIYSTEADIPSWQRPMRIRLDDTFDGWVPTSPLGSPDASLMRVRHPDSNAIYVVNTIGRPTYDSIWFDKPGAFIFTVPAGARRIKAILVGGGGGGTYYRSDYAMARAGGATTFSNLYAAGGPAGDGSRPKWPVVRNGYYTSRGAAAGSSLTADAEAPDGKGFGHGGGVGYGAASTSVMYGVTGYVGAYTEATIDAIPGTIMTGVVGSGAQYMSNPGGNYVGLAAQGCVYLQWGGNIE